MELEPSVLMFPDRLGSRAYGVLGGSPHVLRQPVDELNLAQLAMLAGIMKDQPGSAFLRVFAAPQGAPFAAPEAATGSKPNALRAWRRM